MARYLLSEAKVDKRYWLVIICTAVYLKNRTLANMIKKKTPFGIFFKVRPNVEHLRTYGSGVFVRKPKEKRSSKRDKKADVGISLRYDNVGYRVLLNNKIITARHVVNEDIKYINFDENDYENESIMSDGDNSVFENAGEKEGDDTEVEVINNHLNVPRRSTRERKSPVRYSEVESNNIYVNYCRVENPCTFEEAINSFIN